MIKRLKNFLKPYMPRIAFTAWRFLYWRYKNFLKILLYEFTRLHALLVYPANKVRYLKASRRFLPEGVTGYCRHTCRVFDYNYSLLPNKYIADLESETVDHESASQKTGRSLGYPAWNLLYYSLFCSLPVRGEKVIIVETGTNFGFSTIVMAQVLKDMDIQGFVYTVDINREHVELAKRNIEKAGLSKYVKFHIEDSLTSLSKLVRKVKYINFAFLDDNHKYFYVTKEFSIIYPKIVRCRGKVYFDNTLEGDSAEVTRALHFIKHAYDGNMIEFGNCSEYPPGNVIWQPRW